MSGGRRKKRASEPAAPAAAERWARADLAKVRAPGLMALERGGGAKLGNRPLSCPRGAQGGRRAQRQWPGLAAML